MTQSRTELKEQADKLLSLSNNATRQVSAIECDIQNLFLNKSIRFRKLCKVFSRWRQHSRKHFLLSKVESKLFERTQGAMLSWIWMNWTNLVYKRRTNISRIATTKASILMNKCFKVWREDLLFAIKARTLGQKICMRWKNVCLYWSWVLWHSYFLEVKRLRIFGGKVITKWKNRIIYTAFLPWAAMAACSMNLKKSALFVLARTNRLRIVKGWKAWSFLSDHARQQRQLMGKSIFRLQNLRVVVIIHTWKTRVHGQARMKRTFSRLLEKTACIDSCRVLRAWAFQVKKARKLILCQHRVDLKVRSRLCLNSIMRWQSHAGSVRKLQCVLKRYLSPTAFQAERLQYFWYLWATQHKYAVFLKRRMQSAICNKKNKMFVSTLSKWKKIAHIRSRIKAVIFKGSTRSDRWSLKRLWNSWASNSSTIIFQRQSSLKLMDLAKQRLVALVLMAWESRTRHNGKAKLIISKAGAKYQNQLLDEIVAVWASNAKAFGWMRRLFYKMDQTSRSKALKSVCQAWQSLAMERIHARAAASSTIFRWQVLQLSRSWRGWTKYAEISQRLEFLSSNFIARIHSNTYLAAFSAWRRLCSRIRMLKLHSVKLALQLCSNALAMWALYTQECQVAMRQAFLSMTHMLDISIQTIHFSEAAAMSMWKENVRSARTFKMTIQSLALRRAEYLLGAAVRNWKLEYLSRQPLKEVAGRLYKRFVTKASLMILLAWRNDVQYCVWLRNTNAEVLRNAKRKVLRDGMEGWKLFILEARLGPGQALVPQCIVSC